MSFDGSMDNNNIPTDPMVPHDSLKEPLEWDGNLARIPGLLHETWVWMQRNGILQMLIKKRSRVLTNGKSITDDISVAPLVLGVVDEPEYTLLDPCPPHGERITRLNRWRATPTAAGGGGGLGAWTPPADTAELENMGCSPDLIMRNSQALVEDYGKLLAILTKVFGHAEQSDDLLNEAGGHGLVFLQVLLRAAATATTADRGVVSAEFTRVRTEGVVGELTLKTLAAFGRAYKRARRSVHPASRPSAAEEVDMINLIALGHSSVSETYETRSLTAAPTTFEAAVGILKTILTGRLRAEEALQAKSGTMQQGLVAAQPPPQAPPSGPPSPPSRDDLVIALLTKLVSAQDPNKETGPKKPGKKTKKTKKVQPDRDANGRAIAWKEGMDLCGCGIDGGKHLFRDCPKKAAAAHAQTAAAAASEQGAAAVIEGLKGLSQEQLLAQVGALLGAKSTGTAGLCFHASEDASEQSASGDAEE